MIPNGVYSVVLLKFFILGYNVLAVATPPNSRDMSRRTDSVC